ncbi:MAG: hypothetical protein N2651_06895 [Fimbriimonadales bacterium]|nr:hypothetical protein [Fimbriimonadales bacterium]
MRVRKHPESGNPFREAVIWTPSLGENAYHPGLQAVDSLYSGRIRASDSQLLGSIALDKTLQNEYPEQPRWDYGIGVQQGETVAAIWVEFHPADTNKVDEVLAKLRWLRSWLQQHALDLNRLTPQRNAYHWLATNGCHIQRTSPQARRLFQAGLNLPRKILDLDQLDL